MSHKKPTLPRLLIAFSEAHGPYISYVQELESLLPRLNEEMMARANINFVLNYGENGKRSVLVVDGKAHDEILAFKEIGRFPSSGRRIYEVKVGDREVLAGGTIDAMRLRVVLQLSSSVPADIRDAVEQSLISIIEEKTGDEIVPKSSPVAEITSEDEVQVADFAARLG
jgi:uncharacterized protein (UPF0216 family)